MFYRYAALHGLKVFDSPLHTDNNAILNYTNLLSPLQHPHSDVFLSDVGNVRQSRWPLLRQFHQKVVGQNHSLITLIREPVSNFLVWFYTVIKPAEHVSLKGFVIKKNGRNLILRQFGMRTEDDISEFLQVRFYPFFFGWNVTQ